MRGFRNRRDALALTGADILAHHGVETYLNRDDRVLIRCLLPDHEDRNPSCSVHLADGWFTCFGCGSSGDLVDLHRFLGGFQRGIDALNDLERLAGTNLPTLAPARPVSRGSSHFRQPQPGQPVTAAAWLYEEADGTAAFWVKRIEFIDEIGGIVRHPETGKPRKRYRPFSPGTLRPGYPEPYLGEGTRPLYRLPEILDAPMSKVIWLVEGEPAADALRSTGRVATTSAGGSSAPSKTDWRPLAGRRLVIWPDNDPPGAQYADAVEECLRNLTPATRASRLARIPASLSSGGDAVDFLNARHGVHKQ